MSHIVLALLLALALAASQVSDARKCLPPPAKKHSPPPKHRHSPPPSAVTHTLTIFGDSLSDDGNEFKRTGGLLPNPAIYYKGRYSNGPVWDEYMPSLSGGAVSKVINYAYGGATACDVFNPYNASEAQYEPLNLGNQTNAYLAARAKPSAKVKNVVIIEIGANDFAEILTLALAGGNSTADGELLIGCIVANVVKLAMGGETQIVVGNLPPVQITPELASYPAAILALIAAGVDQINAGLEGALQVVQAQLGAASTLYYLDVNAITYANYLAANATGEVAKGPCVTTVPPNQAGFYGALDPAVNATECASKGVGYYFFDREHPTTTAHDAFATAATAQLKAWGLYN